MKIFQLALIASLVFLFSCNKDDDFNYAEGTVGSSRIVYFPIISLNGDPYVVVEAGGTYDDPGVVAQVNGENVDFTTSGDVDYSTPGVYTVTYSAKNSEGFAASATRKVVVYSTDATAAAHDLSGTYLRSATGASAIWAKVAPGVYRVTNPGGAATALGFVVFAFNPSAYDIFIPEQAANDGTPTSSSDEVFTPGSPDSYVWKIVNPGYGTGLRSFVKQ